MTEAPKGRRIATLRLVREGGFVAPAGHPGRRVQATDASAIYRFMQPFADREVVEAFWILAIDAQMRMMKGAPIVITRGILNSALVHPREVFRAALHANAMSIVAVHNHPSGDATPSFDDREITTQLAGAGKLLGIPVIDYVIVGAGHYVSFAEKGWKAKMVSK